MANRKYLERTLGPDILRISSNDKILLINGPRQVIKSSKMYFLDTGIAAYLAGWTTPEALECGISSRL